MIPPCPDEMTPKYDCVNCKVDCQKLDHIHAARPIHGDPEAHNISNSRSLSSPHWRVSSGMTGQQSNPCYSALCSFPIRESVYCISWKESILHSQNVHLATSRRSPLRNLSNLLRRLHHKPKRMNAGTTHFLQQTSTIEIRKRLPRSFLFVNALVV